VSLFRRKFELFLTLYLAAARPAGTSGTQFSHQFTFGQHPVPELIARRAVPPQKNLVGSVANLVVADTKLLARLRTG
jgi:hypothetical protein